MWSLNNIDPSNPWTFLQLLMSSLSSQSHLACTVQVRCTMTDWFLSNVFFRLLYIKLFLKFHCLQYIIHFIIVILTLYSMIVQNSLSTSASCLNNTPKVTYKTKTLMPPAVFLLPFWSLCFFVSFFLATLKWLGCSKQC